jgi:hypothetical protein
MMIIEYEAEVIEILKSFGWDVSKRKFGMDVPP